MPRRLAQDRLRLSSSLLSPHGQALAMNAGARPVFSFHRPAVQSTAAPTAVEASAAEPAHAGLASSDLSSNAHPTRTRITLKTGFVAPEARATCSVSSARADSRLSPAIDPHEVRAPPSSEPHSSMSTGPTSGYHGHRQLVFTLPLPPLRRFPSAVLTSCVLTLLVVESVVLGTDRPSLTLAPVSSLSAGAV